MSPTPKVLVIDDDREVRLLLPRLHRQDGCELIVPNTIGEAMQSVSQQVFDLVICDINLNSTPSYTGYRPNEGDTVLTGPMYLAQAKRSHVQRILLNSNEAPLGILQELCHFQRHGFLDAVIGVNSRTGQKVIRGVSFSVLNGQEPLVDSSLQERLLESLFQDDLGPKVEYPVSLTLKDQGTHTLTEFKLDTPEEVKCFARDWMAPTIAENWERLCRAD